MASDGGYGSTLPVIAEYLELLGRCAGADSVPTRRPPCRCARPRALADGITDAAVARLPRANRPDESAATLAWRDGAKGRSAGPERALTARDRTRDGLNGDALSLGDVATGCALASPRPAPSDHRGNHRHPELATTPKPCVLPAGFVSTGTATGLTAGNPQA